MHHLYGFVGFFGDLNYRLTLKDRDEAFRLIEQCAETGDYSPIIAYDQLLGERAAGRVFKGFEEGTITFPPTYKYVPKEDVYERRENKKVHTSHFRVVCGSIDLWCIGVIVFQKRVPAYCDRILYMTPAKSEHLTQQWYRRSLEPRCSDHKPVSSLFTVKTMIGSTRPVQPPGFLMFFFELLEILHWFILTGQMALHWPNFYMDIVKVVAYVSGCRLFQLGDLSYDRMQHVVADIRNAMGGTYIDESSNASYDLANGSLGMANFARHANLHPNNLMLVTFVSEHAQRYVYLACAYEPLQCFVVLVEFCWSTTSITVCLSM